MLPDPRAVLSRPAPPPDETLRYGAHPDQVIDLRRPTSVEQRPLVVFIHGGFWRAEWDRAHAGPLAADLAARGWPVATIEYRRTGQAGGGWPGTFDDVRAALSALPAGDAILAGHSAGGHLALWAAGEVPARGVLALAAVCDLRLAHAERLGDDATAALLGGGPADHPDRYAAADPAQRAGLPVPVVLVHGTDDDIVPVEQSRRYAALTGARLTELPGVEHFGVIDPESSAWPAVLTALDSLTGVDRDR